MRGYLMSVMGMCFAVDGLLLAGAGRLTGHESRLGQLLLSAGLGAVYGGACMLPETRFLGGSGWRLLCLAAMGLTAFGLSWGGLRATALFGVLNMAVGGLVLALGGERSGLLMAITVCALCLLGMKGNRGAGGYVPVELSFHGKRERIMALRDTGNTLRDPVSGEQVLVVSGQVALRLLGLTAGQLKSPAETMLQRPVPGLRLIPYHSVGGQGMLLALRLQDVQIGSKRGSAVVAFAPYGLDESGGFQALTGGMA